MDKILITENSAHAELYLLKAEITRLTQQPIQAKMLYQQAIEYDSNLLKRQTILTKESIEQLQK